MELFKVPPFFNNPHRLNINKMKLIISLIKQLYHMIVCDESEQCYCMRVHGYRKCKNEVLELNSTLPQIKT